MGRRKPAPQPPSPSSNSVADQGNAISDYEQQRLLRIRENRARLEALGLPNLASSLLGSQQSPNRQASCDRKRKKKAPDDDYQPSDDEGGDKGESSSSSQDERQEGASGSRRKGKQKISNVAEVKSRSSLRKTMTESDAIDDDEALQQAISLSLGEAKEDSGTVYRALIQNSGSNVDDSGCAKKSKANIKGNAGRRNTRKESKSRVQLTEDEVVAYFFSFDEAGKGHITSRDLERMVAAHNFTWTDTEISHMIHSFDGDGDGKIHLFIYLCREMENRTYNKRVLEPWKSSKVLVILFGRWVEKKHKEASRSPRVLCSIPDKKEQ